MFEKKLGFHLFEILMVLCIISILAALTIPIYISHLTRANRMEAENSLMKLAIAMEKYQIENNTYEDATLSSLHFSEIIANGRYQLSIRNQNQLSYELVAKPLGAQATRDNDCGELILNSNDERKASGENSFSKCW